MKAWPVVISNGEPLMRKIVVVLALLMCAGGVTASAASASHSWGGYHWARTANPFALKVGNNVSSTWTSHFNTAVSDWNASSVMNLTSVAGTAGKRCKAIPGTVQVCNGTYGQNGWLGLASISISGGNHITQGTAKMNDTYFNMAHYNNANEKLHVMCQEVGHDFGLGHTSEDGSSQNTCMDYFSNTGPNATSTTSTHPNAHDYALLEDIYRHLDASSTIALSSAAGPTMADREGVLPYQSQRRDSKRFSVLTERFADGSMRVTHYTWAAHM
jgi:hypothetical protein